MSSTAEHVPQQRNCFNADYRHVTSDASNSSGLPDPTRQLKAPVIMPVLKYIETHLTDHCNLNCKGCGHCAPLANEWFAKTISFRRDMKRLSSLFSNIARIRLMGGEPLLHPGVHSFFGITRQAFPLADIRLVTNGVLLDKMGVEFWNECRKNLIQLDVTLYPPTKKYEAGIIELCKSNDAKSFRISHQSTFICRRTFGNVSSDPFKAMQYCRSQFYCPYLHEGRLFPCGAPITQKILDDYFSLSRQHDKGINIHNPSITGEEIITKLDSPIIDCRCCNENARYEFSWGLSTRDMSEWLKSDIDYLGSTHHAPKQ